MPEWCQQIWPTRPRSWWSIWWNISPLPYDVEHEEEREPPFRQQWWFWFVTCLTATVATNRSYTVCTGLLPVANNISAQMTHS
jgi:hypothetical protein